MWRRYSVRLALISLLPYKRTNERTNVINGFELNICAWAFPCLMVDVRWVWVCVYRSFVFLFGVSVGTVHAWAPLHTEYVHQQTRYHINFQSSFIARLSHIVNECQTSGLSSHEVDEFRPCFVSRTANVTQENKNLSNAHVKRRVSFWLQPFCTRKCLALNPKDTNTHTHNECVEHMSVFANAITKWQPSCMAYSSFS